MEGGQGCLVGLKSVSKSKYKENHPKTYKCCKLSHRGGNLERFIIGRQFLVVLVIFLINMMGESIPGSNPLSLPRWVASVFLDNSLAIILTTIMVGQLPAQVTSSTSMLDFISNYAMLATIYTALFIELSGVLHSVYLVQMAFNRLSKKTYDVKEPVTSSPRTALRAVAYWVRVVFSLVVLSLAFAVTIKALLLGKSGMWAGVGPIVSIVVFFVLLSLAGVMEGMQIAAFALMNMPDEQLMKESPMAHANCQLIFEGKSLQSFLIGRQIFVASLMFIAARVATIRLDENDANIFGVSDSLQSFLDTGLLGAVILTIFGSLIWRIVASSYPVQFMANPFMLVIIRACFALEATGVCSASWLIAIAIKSVFRLKPDHVYLGDDIGVGEDEETQAKANETENEPKRRALFASQRSLKDSVILSSKELSTDNMGFENIDAMVEKLESSVMRSGRMSAVLTTEDIEGLMEELGGEKVEDDESIQEGWYYVM